MINKKVEETIKNLPQKPGVYKYYDADGILIYVGKAKKLKNRVSSYFNKQNDHSVKTRRLVSKIQSIEYTVVESEFDSFLLENSLIKQYQPRYNIQLKDDKSFPYIVILKERFPRIISTRENGLNGKYYGPYSNVKALNAVLDVIRQTCFIRTCTFNLSEENITSNKYKVCLEYHVENCLGPCENFQSEESYSEGIQRATELLKGNVNFAKKFYTDRMQTFASQMEFEKAQKMKSTIDLLDKFQAKTQIVNASLNDHYVYGIIEYEDIFYINEMEIQNGTIINSKNHSKKKSYLETKQEILEHLVISKHKKDSKTTIITDIESDFLESNFNVENPKIGDKKKLISLSIKNATQLKLDKLAKERPDPKLRLLHQMKDDLNLKELPDHIECFDNSNIQGTNPVASMVCFKNTKPSKKDYRHFKIKTVVGPDDFSSMKEIVTRRYTKLVNENLPLPKLIVIDGGKGQLSSACEALKEINLYGKIPIIGIAKRLEEIYYPEDSFPLYLNKKSETLRVIQQLRDEAHRFAITFHRNQRSKDFTKSKLLEIEGFGKKTEQKILNEFKSIKKLKEATEQELIGKLGKSISDKILEAIKKGLL